MHERNIFTEANQYDAGLAETLLFESAQHNNE